MTEQTLAVAGGDAATDRETGAAAGVLAAANAAASVAGMGLAATVLLAVSTESVGALHGRGEVLIALGGLAGTTSTGYQASLQSALGKAGL